MFSDKNRTAPSAFRTKEIFVVTDLLDATEYSKEDLAVLYRRRWEAELNLRSLKTEMQMEHLRCKKPHRVRNEIRAHLLGESRPTSRSAGQRHNWAASYLCG
jgi:IS4 transposase